MSGFAAFSLFGVVVGDSVVFYRTQFQHADTGPTSHSTDPITPSVWQGSHWSGNFDVTGVTGPVERSSRKVTMEARPVALLA